MKILNFDSKFISACHKYGKLFFVCTICSLIISFLILYNLSESKFKSEIVKNINASYDIEQYSVYIVLRDTFDIIPIPYTPESYDYKYNKYSNAEVMVNDNNTITVLLSGIDYSGKILIYNSVENKLYNVLKFSKIIYSGNYKISFTPSYGCVTVTFTLNY